MKSKINLKLLVIVALVGVFTSCSKDEEDNQKPTISNLEIGMENSKEFLPGDELHLEFEASDNEELGYYEVHIHMETKSAMVEWEIEQQWDFDNGLKNSLVHQHEITVPLDAEPGEYHFHLKLVDAAGNSTSVEDDIEILDVTNN